MSEPEYNPYAAPVAPLGGYTPHEATLSQDDEIRRIRSRLMRVRYAKVVFFVFATMAALCFGSALFFDDGTDSIVALVGSLLALFDGIAWVCWLYFIAETIYPLRHSTYSKAKHPLIWHHFIPLASLFLCFKDLDGLWTTATIPADEVDGVSFNRKWTFLRVYWGVRLVTRLTERTENVPAIVVTNLAEILLSVLLVDGLTSRVNLFVEHVIERGGAIGDL